MTNQRGHADHTAQHSTRIHHEIDNNSFINTAHTFSHRLTAPPPTGKWRCWRRLCPCRTKPATYHILKLTDTPRRLCVHVACAFLVTVTVTITTTQIGGGALYDAHLAIWFCRIAGPRGGVCPTAPCPLLATPALTQPHIQTTRILSHPSTLTSTSISTST
jgi:hypothetical protein